MNAEEYILRNIKKREKREKRDEWFAAFLCLAAFALIVVML